MINHTVFRGPLLGTEESGKYETYLKFSTKQSWDYIAVFSKLFHITKQKMIFIRYSGGMDEAICQLPYRLRGPVSSVHLQSSVLWITHIKYFRFFYKIFFKSNLLRQLLRGCQAKEGFVQRIKYACMQLVGRKFSCISMKQQKFLVQLLLIDTHPSQIALNTSQYKMKQKR